MKYFVRILIFLFCFVFLIACSSSWAEDVVNVSSWVDLSTALQSTSNNGKTIKLTANISPSTTDTVAPLEVSGDVNVSLDLNGFTIDRNLMTATENGYVIIVEGGLTLIDSSVDKTGKITGGYSSGDCGGIYFENANTSQINGVIIEGNKASGAGGGIFIKSGILKMQNCTIANNEASNGGGLYIEDNNGADITNCVFANNTANAAGYTGSSPYLGGGIATEIGSSGCSYLHISNTTFYGNVASGDNSAGGLSLGIFNNDETKYELINCIFTGNKGTTCGGIYVIENNRPVDIINCAFINDEATESGLELLLSFGYGNGKCTVTNSLFWNKNADNIIDGKISFDSCAFPSGASIGDSATSTDTVYISGWDNPTSSDETVNGVTHKVFKIDDNLPALGAIVGRGKLFSTASKDILGNSFKNPPSIGLVEFQGSMSIAADSVTGWLGHPLRISFDVTPSGLRKNISWDISGNIPAGFSSSDRLITPFVISGTPSTSGNFSVTVQAGSGDYYASKDITITVKVVELSADKTSAEGVVLMNVSEDFTFKASPDLSSNYSWEVSPLSADNVTASINSDGKLTLKGSPKEAGTFTFSIKAKADNIVCGSMDISLNVIEAYITSLSADITTDKNITCDVGTAFSLSAKVQANCKNGTIIDIPVNSYSLAWSATGLDTSLFTLSNDGKITANESAAGKSYDITFKVTATLATSADITGSADKVITVYVKDIAPVVESSFTASAVKGKNFSFDVTASKGTNLKWSYTGNIPKGLTASSADKKFTVSGTPARSASGEYTITVTAQNTTANTAQATLKITVRGGNITVSRTEPQTTTDSDGSSNTHNTTSFKNEGGQSVALADIAIRTDSAALNGFTGHEFIRRVSVDIMIQSDDSNYHSWSADLKFDNLPSGFKILGDTSFSGRTEKSHKFAVDIVGSSGIAVNSAVKITAGVKIFGGEYDSSLNASCDKTVNVILINPSAVSLDVEISGDKSLTIQHGETGNLTLSEKVRAYYNDGTSAEISEGYTKSWSTTASYTGVTFADGVLSVGTNALSGSYDIPVKLTVTYGGVTGSDDVTMKLTVIHPALESIDISLSMDNVVTATRGSTTALKASVTEIYSDNTRINNTDNYSFTWNAENLPAGFTLSGSSLLVGMNAEITAHNLSLTIEANPKNSGGLSGVKSASLTVNVKSGDISHDTHAYEDIITQEGSESRQITIFTENQGGSGDFSSVIFLSADISITTESTDFEGINGVYFSMPVSVDVNISQDTQYYTFTSYTLSLDITGLDWLKVSGDKVIRDIPIASRDFGFMLSGTPTASVDKAPVKISAVVLLSGDMELEASCDKTITLDIRENVITSLDVKISGDKTLTAIHGTEASVDLQAIVTVRYADGYEAQVKDGYSISWSSDNLPEGFTLNNATITAGEAANIGTYSIDISAEVSAGGLNAKNIFTLNAEILHAPLQFLSIDMAGSKDITVPYISGGTLVISASAKATYTDRTIESPAVTWSYSKTLPVGISFANASGTASLNIAPRTKSGRYTITLIAQTSDSTGSSATESADVSITVSEPGLSSVSAEINNSSLSMKRGSTVQFTASAYAHYEDERRILLTDGYSLVWSGSSGGLSMNSEGKYQNILIPQQKAMMKKARTLRALRCLMKPLKMRTADLIR